MSLGSKNASEPKEGGGSATRLPEGPRRSFCQKVVGDLGGTPSFCERRQRASGELTSSLITCVAVREWAR